LTSSIISCYLSVSEATFQFYSLAHVQSSFHTCFSRIPVSKQPMLTRFEPQVHNGGKKGRQEGSTLASEC